MSAKKTSYADIKVEKKDADKMPSSTGIDGVLDLSSSRWVQHPDVTEFNASIKHGIDAATRQALCFKRGPPNTATDASLHSDRSSSLRSDSEVDAASSTAGPFPDDDQGSITPDEFHVDLDDEDVEPMESEGSEADLSLRKMSISSISPLSSNGRNKLEVN